MSHQGVISHNELLLLVEGEVSQSRAQEIQAHVALCDACRDRLQQLRTTIEALGQADEELKDLDLFPSVRKAVAARDEARSQRAWNVHRYVWGFASASAVAAALLIAFLMTRPSDQPSENGEFRARTSSTGGPDPKAWVGIQAFRVVDGQPAAPLGDVVAVSDALVFAYSNAGANPFRYLMIFAVAKDGETFWYYPAFNTPGTDPESIPISQGLVGVELPDRVKHNLPAGELTIYGLFSLEPLKVSEVERTASALAQRGDDEPTASGDLSPDKTLQHVLHTRVR